MIWVIVNLEKRLGLANGAPIHRRNTFDQQSGIQTIALELHRAHMENGF